MWDNELIFGLICFIIGILLGVREIKLWNNLEQNDYIRKSFSIQKIGGIIGLLLVGIVTFYRYFT
tara:strand:- start:155 stop:349 length:195 start_codon:yes stop_codon:yes gene_type:complete